MTNARKMAGNISNMEEAIFYGPKKNTFLKWKLHRQLADLLHNSTVVKHVYTVCVCTCVAWVHEYVLLQAPCRWLIHHITTANGRQATLRFNAADRLPEIQKTTVCVRPYTTITQTHGGPGSL